MAIGERIRGTVAAAVERRRVVLALFGSSTEPLSEEDVWDRAKPRMRRSEARHAVKTLLRHGAVSVARLANFNGKPTTYVLATRAKEAS